MKYSTGEVYTGEFQNDMMHGNGEMMYTNVMVYKGMWYCNLVSGERERERYHSSYCCIQKHGVGTMVYEDESEYVGSWDMDLRHGEGNLKRKDGITYSGNWLQDQPHGEKGELNIPTANYKYVGECHVTGVI